MEEKYTVTIIIQTASGTYSRTLVFDTQTQADQVQASLSEQIDETWGD